MTLTHTAMQTPLTFAMKPTRLPALKCLSLTPVTKVPRWPPRPLLPRDDPFRLKSSNPYSVVLPSKLWIDMREESSLIYDETGSTFLHSRLNYFKFLLQLEIIKVIFRVFNLEKIWLYIKIPINAEIKIIEKSHRFWPSTGVIILDLV